MATNHVQTLQSLGIAPYRGNAHDLRLDLNYHNIQQLPFDLFKLTDLQWLNLNVNKLRELPREFRKLKRLKWLYLEANQFERFPMILCELTELIRLYMSGNRLKVIPKDIGKLTNLKWIDFSDNEFWEFPLGLCDKSMTNLEKLLMDGNKLASLPAQISLLKGLKVLWLNDNQLEWLPQSICELHNLEELQLKNNPLKMLPAYFGDRLENLKTLDCKGCAFIRPLDTALSAGMDSLREYQRGVNRRSESLKMVYFKPQKNDRTWERPSYRMRTRPRGVAVIIDNFCELDTTGKYHREGADSAASSDSSIGSSIAGHTSTDMLRSVLLKLGFNVRMMRGLMSLDIISALRFLSLEDHSYFDCMMICVLSFGSDGKIMGPDGISVDVKQLTDIFSCENCPTLAGKPKLFFFQILQSAPRRAPANGGEAEKPKGKLDSPRDPHSGLIPEEDDFLVTVAMVPQSAICESLKDVYTLYVSVLFGMLEKFARKLNILDVLTAVHGEVRTLKIATVDGQGTSIHPFIQTSLKYDLYLSVPVTPTSPVSSLGMGSP